MKRSCIGIVVVIALASAMASGAAAQAGEQPDELILLNIDQRLQVFREAADEADLTPAQREKVDAVLGRQRTMAAELLPRTRGPDATTRPMDVIMAAESNAQKGDFRRSSAESGRGAPGGE